MVNPTKIPLPSDLQAWSEAINSVLRKYSDKDWNYSRISLIIKPLDTLDSPYALHIDWIQVSGKAGKQDYQEMLREITWGVRHSNELGILELASLRMNQALNAVSSADYWSGIRPVVRLRLKSELLGLSHTHAFWYQIKEVQGDEFENR